MATNTEPVARGHGIHRLRLNRRMHHVPNAITVSRIVALPIFLAFFFWDTLFGQVVALIIFVLAAISDYYDGWLARKYGVRSGLGQFLDPVADKVLVLGALTAMAILLPAIVPWWGLGIIALRDIYSTMMRLRARGRGRELRTISMAKVKTTLQLVFIMSVLLVRTLLHIPGQLEGLAIWIMDSGLLFYHFLIVVGLTAFTGVWYYLRAEYE